MSVKEVTCMDLLRGYYEISEGFAMVCIMHLINYHYYSCHNDLKKSSIPVIQTVQRMLVGFRMNELMTMMMTVVVAMMIKLLRYENIEPFR